MEQTRTFESASNDTSFPWKVFIVTFALYFVSSNLWALTENKSISVFILVNIGSVLLGFLLAKFIQKLKVLGTLPPISVSDNGVYIESGIGFGRSYIQWNQIQKIRTFKMKDQNGKFHPAVEVEVLDARSVIEQFPALKKAIWQFIALFGAGRKFRIIDLQLAESLDELVNAIDPHHRVIHEI